MSTVLLRQLAQPQQGTVIEPGAASPVSLSQGRVVARHRRIARFWLAVSLVTCIGAFALAWLEGLRVS